jgi:hypothetical protein
MAHELQQAKVNRLRYLQIINILEAEQTELRNKVQHMRKASQCGWHNKKRLVMKKCVC